MSEKLEYGLKYELDTLRKLKKEYKRIEEEILKCEERICEYNSKLNYLKRQPK